MNSKESTVQVLLVEDEPGLRRALAAVLFRSGYQVTSCERAPEALKTLQSQSFDVVVSDVLLPDISGIELLHEIRRRDRDVPVVLMTGAPSLKSAMHAIEHGAFKYLVKPVENDALLKILKQAVQVRRLAEMKRQAQSALGTSLGEGADRASLEVSFANALETLWLAFQPIVRARDGSVFGFEALLRSDEPRLPDPNAVIHAAQRLNELPRLGRLIRDRAVEPMLSTDDSSLFVNLHPGDLLDEDLFRKTSPLSGIANRVVLELTERESLTGVPDVRSKIESLRALGFRIAVDDLGAGYDGFASFAQLEPDMVKLDISLVRSVDWNPTKRRLIESMASTCHDMGLLVVAEGVETEQERDTLVDLGVDLLQGHRFGRPGPPFVEATW